MCTHFYESRTANPIDCRNRDEHPLFIKSLLIRVYKTRFVNGQMYRGSPPRFGSERRGEERRGTRRRERRAR